DPRGILERLARTTRGCAGAKVLVEALAIERTSAPLSGDAGSGDRAALRTLADRELAAAITRLETFAPERLARDRQIFERLGDREGEGVLLARVAAVGASSGASGEETRALYDAAADTFDRAGDPWSASAAREASALLEGDG